jgi:hypothetical protein
MTPEPEPLMQQIASLSSVEQKLPLFTREFEEEKAKWEQTLAETLASLQQSNLTLRQELSATSETHPYIKTLQEYWPEGTPSFKFDGLAEVDHYDHEAVSKMLLAIDEEFVRDTQERLEFLSTTPNPEHQMNCVISCADREGDTYVVNKEKMRKHLKFINFLKEADVDGMKANPVKATRKMVMFYIDTYADFFPRTKELYRELFTPSLSSQSDPG